MGRPQSPERQRFEPAGREGGIYLVEIGDAVKVGHSWRPCQRLYNLHKAHAPRGENLGRFAVIAFGDRMSSWGRGRLELKCIHALAAVAANLPRRREYFTGISFEQALQLVRGALSA